MSPVFSRMVVGLHEVIASLPRSAGLLAILLAAMFAPVAQAQSAWALKGAKIYPAPDAPPIENGSVIVAGARIESVGSSSNERSLAANPAPQCDGGVVVSGFQNSHVHILGDGFLDAATRPADALNAALTEMLVQYGYTTVFDIASDRDNTLALRARINKGEVRGPRILTVGLPFFPHNGIPAYMKQMPKAFLEKLPQPAEVGPALKVLRENFAAGTDGAKLFIATPQADGTIKRIPAEIAKAVAEETHRRGKLVFAHPTDIAGIQASLDAHVDILAHPPFSAEIPWSETVMKAVRDTGMSMTPTLKLLPYELKKEQVPPAVAEKIVDAVVMEFGKFFKAGGQILFGTDVGYMTDHDPTLEYELMAKAGMTPMQILASLTTSPAARWNEQGKRGRLAAGMDADIVVLNADPEDAPRNFANVRCVIRAGEVIYSRGAASQR